MQEERTRIGRAPTQVEVPRPSEPKEPKPTGIWNFTEDGLENRGEARSNRVREDRSAGRFEGQERPRSTGERPRLRTQTQDGAERGPRFEDPGSQRTTGERPRLRTRTQDGSERSPRFENPGQERPRATGERPRLPTGERPRLPTGERPQPGTGERPRLRTRTQEGAEPGNRFENPASPRTSERPRLPERRPVEIPRQGAEAVPVPVSTPEGPEASGDAKPLEDLLPVFSESIGQESLALHFGEELRFLGAELRPSRLPPGERAARLWAFFLAYAEANAKDPAGQSEAGRERFREVLTEHGFSGLYDVNTGRDGVEVALELLKARSPEELKQKLAEVRIEPRPETLPSEVSIPVEPHTAPLEHPAAERPATPEQKAHAFEPAAERQVQQPKQEQAGFDQKEQPTVLALQTNAAPQGVVQPPVPGLRTQTGLEVTANPEDELANRDRRGTNKRLGPHMLWNALHGFRDSQEDTALKREQWSQLAFGAIISLVGAALLVAMLASL
ncbi:hypothetical protein ATI61_107306 [Archangium gephyra]|uniref:Immediate early protein ICP0 n=2 Tax=Archangium gephyra TaxID=48 RepID=A0AAC8TKB2_9BACT|nr:Hypothetical protein AA314_09487 [Archangium gephyra]REG29610.1 hypothetical protein ATI61_107306 [Archangium gephyra]